MNVGPFHLTYCSNIHAGEAWPQVNTALTAALPAIRQHLGWPGPMAIGLRLSADAAATLAEDDALRAFRDFLHAGDFYVPTINGFPFGAFHGTRVKERVYEPDWRSEARMSYSNTLAGVLAALRTPHSPARLSISTVPGAFRPHVRSDGDARAIAVGMLRHAAFLRRLRLEIGTIITLAIEPEPACFIETVSEAIAFFQDQLLRPINLAAAARATGIDLTADDVRTHIGLCLDTCHMAVEFEDPRVAIDEVMQAGITLAKVQLSSALRVVASEDRSGTPSELLEPFAEDTYLHQVVIANAQGLHRFTDLPEALQSSCAGEWRVHFHVPIFMEQMSGFRTTQRYLTAVLDELVRGQIATCLEVETYTWDVLPAEYRTTDVHTAIARELEWVRRRLHA